MPFEMLILKVSNINDNLPEEIQIAPLGEYEDAYGRKFKLTEDNIPIIMNQYAQKKTQLVIDYEHQTLSGNEAPAAGWIRHLINKGKDGLWAAVEWTKKAKEYLQNKEYRYLSPVLLAAKKDNNGIYIPEVLHSAALTNTPQIDGMVPIVNCGKTCKLHKEILKQEEDGMLKKIVELLGLKSEATENEAIAALTVLKNKADTSSTEIDGFKSELKKVRIALGLQENANIPEITGTILALKQPASAVSVQEFQLLKKELAERKRDELVAIAMKEGKISAAQKDWADTYAANDPEGFKVFVAKAPVLVPMGTLPAGGKKVDGELDDTTMHVAKMMGNKPEDVKKHVKQTA